MKKFSIVIPCYNEAKNIPLILERLNHVLTREDIEIILVDNGSTDESSQVLSDLLPKYKFARSINVRVNEGYGFGILSGLRASSAEFVGWTHADMQTDPFDIIRAIEIIEKVDGRMIYVKGKRSGRPIFDQLFTTGMSVFESIYMKKTLWDINAQPNIFPRTFFLSWEKPPHDFALDLYAIYQAKMKGFKLIRFPVIFPPRIHGVSSWNHGLQSKWKFIKRTVEFSLKLKKELKD
jgi:glycosyltransferase involved in cell wall biosynthesis